MVWKCLNSCCNATFRYLGKGRLYCMDHADLGRRKLSTGKKTVISIRSKAWPVEYFWLCERCAAMMNIELSDAGELRLVPVDNAARGAAAGAAPAVAGAAPRKNAAQSIRTATNDSDEAAGRAA